MLLLSTCTWAWATHYCSSATGCPAIGVTSAHPRTAIAIDRNPKKMSTINPYVLDLSIATSSIYNAAHLPRYIKAQRSVATHYPRTAMPHVMRIMLAQVS